MRATLFLAGFLLCALPAAAQDETRGAPAEPENAAELRALISSVEHLMPSLPDKASPLFLLAIWKQRLGETREAMDLLKKCAALEEGFDPSSEPTFDGLKGSKEFDALGEKARQKFPVVAQAEEALRTEEKDLVPEGLAYDPSQNVFYLSSLNRRKIVRITPENRTSDFVPGDQYSLLPVLGIRMDSNDGSVWAASAEEKTGRSELLHFDPTGKLFGRFPATSPGPHEFNDLVVRKNGEVIVTDTFGNRVLRFSLSSKSFMLLTVHRPLFSPNGIALSDDGTVLYIADLLGVVAMDFSGAPSIDVDPGQHNTLAGIDGLYWRNGSLIAVQNSIGPARIAAFRLSKDGTRVTHATILENRSPLTELPTTGAIRGNDFYFVVNSQIDNLNGDRVMDVTRLERIRIGVLHLP